MEPDKKAKSRLEMWMQVGGFVVGLVALLATIFFSVKADRNKELTLTYTAKRPLLISENSRTTATLEVRVAGNKVAAPWLVSARLQNTGGLPIEERDIETHLALRFVKTKLLSVDVVQKSADAVYSQVTLDNDTAKLQHKLLNPGDWIAFDIVLDGEPALPPETLFRISGVSSLQTVLQTAGQPKVHLTVVELPRPVVFVLAIACALIGFVFVGMGSAEVLRALRAALALPSPRASGLADSDLTLRMAGTRPTTQTSSALYSLLGRRLTPAELDDPHLVARLIAEKAPAAMLEELGTTPEQAAAALCSELRTGLRDALATHVFVKLPSGLDRTQEAVIRSLDMESVSAAELIRRVDRVLRQPGEGLPFRQRINGAEVGSTLAMALLGVALLLIVGGTLRTALTM